MNTLYSADDFPNAIHGDSETADGKEAPFTCKYCGMPSWIDPAYQSPPADYCHESDHGTEEDQMF